MKRKAWNKGKRTEMLVTVTEALAATDKGSLYHHQVWLDEYTYGEGLYFKEELSDSSDFFFSNVESSHGESDSDGDYCEESFKNNKEIELDYGNTL